MSGVTLTHAETDVEPECMVVFGGGRLREDGCTDGRRIEVVFGQCYYALAGPHPDNEDVECLGYRLDKERCGERDDYLAWLRERWRATGICPDSRFYVASQSDWLEALPSGYREGFNHYVVFGRDGHVEVIARGFRWREWRWDEGDREEAPAKGPAVAEGEGVS